MIPRIAWLVFACIAVAACSLTEADALEKKKRTGSVTGEIKSSKASPNGKNQLIEVLAVGEESPRKYRVGYDPKAKAPLANVLKAVRAAKVGDRVQLEWLDSGEGLAITEFMVLKKK